MTADREAFQLHQNYPNPFNPSTVVSFSIAREEQVRLNVYNLLGEKVASLLDKRLGAGLYMVNFDASEVARRRLHVFPGSGKFQRIEEDDAREVDGITAFVK